MSTGRNRRIADQAGVSACFAQAKIRACSRIRQCITNGLQNIIDLSGVIGLQFEGGDQFNRIRTGRRGNRLEAGITEKHYLALLPPKSSLLPPGAVVGHWLNARGCLANWLPSVVELHRDPAARGISDAAPDRRALKRRALSRRDPGPNSWPGFAVPRGSNSRR